MQSTRFAVLGLVAVSLAGCLRLTPTPPPATSGIFKSYDHAERWVPRNLFLHSGGTGSIGGVNITKLFFDPQDFNAIYAGTTDNGLLYSLDGGESWMRAKGLSTGRVSWVAVDPQDKCTIYAVRANTVLKSIDCTRTWAEVYIDTVSTKSVTSIAIDRQNPTVLYAGNSAGDILKSEDAGGSWRVIYSTKTRVTAVLLDLNDSRVIYAATDRKGIFKSTNSGVDWVDLNDGLKPFSGALEYRNLLLLPDVENGLLLTAKYGLLVSLDGGTSWQAIKLITPPTTTEIYAVTVNPKNSKEIYYATASTFYKTVDGGVNWVTKRMPSTALPSYLLVNPDTPNLMYLGLNVPPKK